MEEVDFDVLIVGAGPAGCSTAISLADTGLRIALIDKATFPREKVCGDGLTIDSINQLKKLSPRLAENIHHFEKKITATGCVITSTKGYRSFFNIPENQRPYIIQRIYFDNELLNECKNYHNITVFENTRLLKISISDQQVSLETSGGHFSGKMLVGADGVNSLIAKFINPDKPKETLYGVSVRAYFSNVQDDDYQNVIEIHYLESLIPGYFWIFHMHNNLRNVGLGIDERMMKKNGLNLSEVFQDIINNHPRFKDRFKNATMQGDLKAHRISAFNRYRPIYGNRVLLAGDAANLLNPLSGEGVGNALRSGRFAAEHIKKCFAANDFSKDFNRNYYKKIKRTMFPELTRHGLLAILNKKEWLSNYALKHNSLLNRFIRALVK